MLKKKIFKYWYISSILLIALLLSACSSAHKSVYQEETARLTSYAASSFETSIYKNKFLASVATASTDTWKTITFDTPFDSVPVIIPAPDSFRDNSKHRGKYHFRIKDVTKKGFSYKAELWAYEQNIAPFSVLMTYIAVPAGKYSLSTGEVLEVMSKEVVNYTEFKTSETDLNDQVYTQVQTFHGKDPCVTRIKKYKDGRVNVWIQEEEKKGNLYSHPAKETLGLIRVKAIPDSNLQTIVDVNNNPVIVKDFVSAMVISGNILSVTIHGIQTMNGKDTAFSILDSTSVHVQEEMSRDSETAHTFERIALTTFRTGYTPALRSGLPLSYRDDVFQEKIVFQKAIKDILNRQMIPEDTERSIPAPANNVYISDRSGIQEIIDIITKNGITISNYELLEMKSIKNEELFAMNLQGLEDDDQDAINRAVGFKNMEGGLRLGFQSDSSEKKSLKANSLQSRIAFLEVMIRISRALADYSINNERYTFDHFSIIDINGNPLSLRRPALDLSGKPLSFGRTTNYTLSLQNQPFSLNKPFTQSYIDYYNINISNNALNLLKMSIHNIQDYKKIN